MHFFDDKVVKRLYSSPASQTLLLGPRFLLSSIKVINCLEKVVDRGDLAE